MIRLWATRGGIWFRLTERSLEGGLQIIKSVKGFSITRSVLMKGELQGSVAWWKEQDVNLITDSLRRIDAATMGDVAVGYKRGLLRYNSQWSRGGYY
jgi:hypothetical protein